MKISLENVAIVKKSEIELKGITVAAGLNGTGKTTVGKSIYATINAYKSLPRRIIESKRRSIWQALILELRNNSQLAETWSFFDVAQEFMSNLTDDMLLKWKKDFQGELLYKDLCFWFKKKEEIHQEEIESIYKRISSVLQRPDKVEILFLVESYYRDVFERQINCVNSDEQASVRLSFGNQDLEAVFVDNHLDVCGYDHAFEKKAVYIESHNILDMYRTYKLDEVKSTVASKDLFQYLDKDDNSDLTFEEYANEKEVKRIIDVIINEVTHGTLNVDSTDDVLFYDRKLDHSIQVSNLSAGLKIFVVIQKLLENGTFQKGDILLIDEPEVNLHPEWQVLFAEILVLLHKELGVVLYINTHSPYFIRAIEVQMAEKEIADKGKFYLFETDNDGLCRSRDVTESTEEIYSLLYKPLESM